MTTSLEQFIFNRVVIHQLAQGKRCTVRGRSVIRHKKLASPIGAVIVNSAEAQAFGTASVAECASLLAKSGLDVSDVGTLLDALQSVHDECHNSEWENEFRTIADNFELTFPEAAAMQAKLSRGALRTSFAKKAWATRIARPKAAGHKARATALINQ